MIVYWKNGTEAISVAEIELMLEKCQSIHEHLASGIQMLRDEVLDLLDASGGTGETVVESVL